MTDSAPEKIQKTRPNKQKSGFGLSLIASFAIVVALAAIYMNRQLTLTVAKQTKAFEATLNMLTQQQSSTEARLQAHRAVTLSHEERAKTEQKIFEEKIRTSLAESHNLSDDWRLLKARHLLELAELNAHWSTDKATTVAMLNDADAVLAPLHNPALTPVRKALAKDIHATESAPITDVTRLLTQLSAAEEATWALTLIPLPKASSEAPAKDDHLGRIAKYLQHVVTIKHHDKLLEPKPTLAFEAMLRATVRFSLKEAEWAVLERNNTVYQLALTQAMQYLEQSFMPDSTATQALLAKLDQLKQVKLEAEMVIPEQALTKLNQVIAAHARQVLGETS